MPQDPDFRSSVPGEGGRCQSYYPGHNTHWIHARRVGQTPWGWRDGVVTAVDGRTVSVDYVLEDGHPRVWHHADLSAELRPGDPVRVHEENYVLGGPFGWLNVVVTSGLGPVPTPPDPAAWASEVTGGVQDLGTGRGLAVDWRSTAGEGSVWADSRSGVAADSVALPVEPVRVDAGMLAARCGRCAGRCRRRSSIAPRACPMTGTQGV